jgi:hypothetical protein
LYEDQRYLEIAAIAVDIGQVVLRYERLTGIDPLMKAKASISEKFGAVRTVSRTFEAE